MKISISLAILASMVCSSGCKSSIDSAVDAIAMHKSSAPSLAIPKAQDVTSIEVTDNSHVEEKKLKTITDPDRISKFLALVGDINNGWYTQANTFPGPQYTLTLQNGNDFLMVLWLGPNWIGGRDNTTIGKRLRDASSSDINQLGQLIDIKSDFGNSGRIPILGRWKVTHYAFDRVSAMDKNEADRWINKIAEFDVSKAGLSDAPCKNPSYTSRTESTDKYFEGFKTSAADIGLHQDSIELITVACKSYHWGLTPWSRIIKLNENQIMVTWDGVFFTLEKVK